MTFDLSVSFLVLILFLEALRSVLFT